MDVVINQLRDIDRQMLDLYKELDEKYSEFNKTKIEEINNIRENINNVEIWYEKNIIEYFLRHMNDQKDKAAKYMENIDTYKNNIEIISKQINPENYVETLNKSNMYSYVEKANDLFYKQINNIIINSNQLKNEAFTIDELQNIQKNRKNLLTKKQQIIQYTNEIENIFNEIKNINNILVLTNYKSILQDISQNINHVSIYTEQLHNLYIKLEEEKEQMKTFYHKSNVLHNQINFNEDAFINNLLINIEKIKNDITHIKEKTNIYMIDVNKSKNNAQLYFHNTLRGNEKIEYLKNLKNSTNQQITLQELKQVQENVEKVKDIYNQTIKYEEKIKTNYHIITDYENKINDILHNSFIKQINMESSNNKKQTKQIIDIINDKTFEEHIKTSKTKINMLKEQSQMKHIDKTLLNEQALKLFVDINSTNNNLDNMLSEINSIQNNIHTYIQEANKSFDKFKIICDQNVNDLLNKLSLGDLNYMNHLKNLQNEIRNMNLEKNFMLDKSKKIDEEEKKLDILKVNISNINNSLDKLKKYYEEALFQKVKEKAEIQKENIEKIKQEINTLSDVFKKPFFFIQLNTDSSQHEKDINNNVETYKNNIDEIYNVFIQSYNLIQKYSSEIFSSTLNYIQTKEIKEKSIKEQNQLNQNEKEASVLLKNIKINETIKLFKQIKNERQNDVHNIKEDYNLLQQYLNYMKNEMEQLKKYKNDVHMDKNYVENNNGEKEKLLKGTISSYYDKINNINNKLYIYKNKEDTYFNNMIKISEILNIIIKKKQQNEQRIVINAEYDSSLINKDEEIKKEINNQIIELNKHNENISNIFKDIQNIKKQSQDIITNMNDMHKSTILLVDIIQKKEEALNKQKNILRNIDNILNKKENIIDKVIKCNCDDYKDILIQNETEYQKLQNINHTYEEKKKSIDILKIKNIKQKNIQEYKNKLEQMNTIINQSIEQHVFINADILQNEKIKLEEIIKNLDILDEQIMTYHNSIDELYKLGIQCDNHLITTISVVVNKNTTKIMIHIKKQKEDIQKINNYIQTNYNIINEEALQFHRLYGHNLISEDDKNNLVHIIKEQKNIYTQKEIDISKIIKHVKKGLYSLNEHDMNHDTHMNIINEHINNNILQPYTQLINMIKDIDNVFIKIQNNKFEQIQKYIEIIKSLEQLNKNINTDNLNKLKDTQNKLINIETEMKHKQKQLINKMNDIEKDNITDQYMHDVQQNIFEPITLKMNEYNTLLNDDHNNNINNEHQFNHLNSLHTKIFSHNYNKEQQQEYITNIMQRIDVFINDLDTYQYEYYFYEWNQEYKQIDKNKINQHINNIKNNLIHVKKQFEHTLENIKNNENIFDNIQLKKKDIDDIIININNTKETYLKELNKKKMLQNKKKVDEKSEINNHHTLQHDNQNVEQKNKIKDHNLITKPNNNSSEESHQNEQMKEQNKNILEKQTRNIKPHHVHNHNHNQNQNQKDSTKLQEQDISTHKLHNTIHEQQSKDNHQGNREKKQKNGNHERMYFASGIVVSILFLSSLGFVINSKNNKQEYDKEQEKQQQNDFVCDNNKMDDKSTQKYGRNQEEVMEISFDNDYI